MRDIPRTSGIPPSTQRVVCHHQTPKGEPHTYQKGRRPLSPKFSRQLIAPKYCGNLSSSRNATIVAYLQNFVSKFIEPAVHRTQVGGLLFVRSALPPLENVTSKTVCWLPFRKSQTAQLRKEAPFYRKYVPCIGLSICENMRKIIGTLFSISPSLIP